MAVSVVKIGGSLCRKPRELRLLCEELCRLALERVLIVVPGGAEFADCVRNLDKRFCLSPILAHRMAILGMDQYGLLLSGMFSKCHIVDNLARLKRISTSGVVLFLPSKFMFEVDPLENSWDVTSDSIAAYVAGRIGAEKLVLVKDVDGVFSGDPKVVSDAKLFGHLTVEQLSFLKGSLCVDTFLSKVLLDFNLKCYVVNGFFPDRVRSVLNDEDTVCTLISR